jgi:hypothetical protein
MKIDFQNLDLKRCAIFFLKFHSILQYMIFKLAYAKRLIDEIT